ncbi:DUF3954 domain-containing protein [Planomicrobium sp. MB-3u-38]|nr:DUF3954 domain-containing protein [Planomicrobium sp. MB-3u-38]
MIAEIDLRENAAYVVKDGVATKLNPMESGTDEIIWKRGIVLDVVRSHRIRLGHKKEIGNND